MTANNPDEATRLMLAAATPHSSRQQATAFQQQRAGKLLNAGGFGDNSVAGDICGSGSSSSISNINQQHQQHQQVAAVCKGQAQRQQLEWQHLSLANINNRSGISC